MNDADGSIQTGVHRREVCALADGQKDEDIDTRVVVGVIRPPRVISWCGTVTAPAMSPSAAASGFSPLGVPAVAGPAAAVAVAVGAVRAAAVPQPSPQPHPAVRRAVAGRRTGRRTDADCRAGSKDGGCAASIEERGAPVEQPPRDRLAETGGCAAAEGRPSL